MCVISTGLSTRRFRGLPSPPLFWARHPWITWVRQHRRVRVSAGFRGAPTSAEQFRHTVTFVTTRLHGSLTLSERYQANITKRNSLCFWESRQQPDERFRWRVRPEVFTSSVEVNLTLSLEEKDMTRLAMQLGICGLLCTALVACGAEPPEGETDDGAPIVDPSASEEDTLSICGGINQPNAGCWVRCCSGHWYFLGDVGWGNCNNAGANFCGCYDAACWGSP